MLAMQVNHSSLFPSFAPCSSPSFPPRVRSLARSFLRSFVRSLTRSLTRSHAHVSFSHVLRTSRFLSLPSARSLSLSHSLYLPLSPRPPFHSVHSLLRRVGREKATRTLHRIPAAASRASPSRPACILSLSRSLVLSFSSTRRCSLVIKFCVFQARVAAQESEIRDAAGFGGERACEDECKAASGFRNTLFARGSIRLRTSLLAAKRRIPRTFA